MWSSAAIKAAANDDPIVAPLHGYWAPICGSFRVQVRSAAPAADRLPDGRLSESLAALRAAGVAVWDDAAARGRLAELRVLYEPVAAGLAGHCRLPVP
jgi:hypothetical protein